MAEQQPNLTEPFSSQPRCVSTVGIFVNTRSGQVLPATCKRWACPACGPRRVRRFMRRVRSAGDYRYLITLTLAGDARAIPENAVRLARGWRALYYHLRRRAGLTNYAWAREIGTKGGRLHMHSIANCKRFDYRAARAVIAAGGLGRVCDFKRVRLSASGYLVKYLTKEPGVRFPRYMRRAQTSVHEAREPNPDWIFIRSVHSPWLRRAEPPRIVPTDVESLLRAEALALKKREKVCEEFVGPLFAQGP